jgi:signal transduction histidine kinase
MSLQSLCTHARSLRTRLMVWNGTTLALTGLLILLSLRTGVRYTLLYDLDQVLREDLKELRLHFAAGRKYDWATLAEELNRKAQGHDFHQWFVQFYDAQGQPIWSSTHAPALVPLSAAQTHARSFTKENYRLCYAPVDPPILVNGQKAHAVCVGCSQRYLARDMATIDRLVLGAGLIVLCASPLVGFVLTTQAVRPLVQMIRTTSRLHPGKVDERVPIRGTGDELDSLAQTINGLLDRIADYLRQEHEFLASAAHDLRTPLAAIRSTAEVGLSTPRSGEEYREILALVVEQCGALQTLVNQLLLMAESEADCLNIDAAPVPLDQVVMRVCEMFAGVAEERGIALKVGPLPSVWVAGKRHHLWQVVSNLVDNAIKFTAARHACHDNPPEGSAKLTGWKGLVRVDLIIDDETGQARLRVRDNGIGIPAEHLPHIFERFYRVVDRARGRGGVEGSGLGLSICKAIVTSHGGQIAVTSRPGHGATFVVTLPLLRVAPDAASPSPLVEAAPARPSSP